MKHILTIIWIFLAFTDSYAQSPSNTLRKYKNDQNVFSIKYQGENLNKFIKKSKDNPLKSKIDFVDIYLFKAGSMISPKDNQSILANLKSSKYEELVSVKDKRGTLKVFSISTGNTMSKMYANLSSTGKENYFVLLEGNIYLNEISEIVEQLNMKELDFLKTAF